MDDITEFGKNSKKTKEQQGTGRCGGPGSCTSCGYIAHKEEVKSDFV